MMQCVKSRIFLFLAAAIVFSGLCAKENDQSSGYINPIIYSSYEGRQWVEECVKQHPEILWLADSNVRQTEEGQAIIQGSYSEQLFGQKFVEFDRTIMTIHCLKLILDGSDKAYEVFTAAQPTASKLTKDSFQALHMQGQKLLTSKWQGLSMLEMANAMETALVLGDIGKSEKARELFRPYGVCQPDHDDFHGEAMLVIEKNSNLCPSFARLSSSAKNLLIEVANLAHYGHITHLEGDLSMFSKLKDCEIACKDPVALDFDLFVHTCDVAGALGHVNNQSSLVYNEYTHRAMQAMEDSVRVLSNPLKTESDAYQAYVKVRASWLGLNADDSSDRVLVRIGAMLRLFSVEEGCILREAMNQLPINVQQKIAAQLDVQKQNQLYRTATYMPAVLVNLSNNLQLGSSQQKRLCNAISLGLPFIASVLEKYKEMLANLEIDPCIPLNFNGIAGVVKASPDSLNKEFSIDKDGNVFFL